jgi:two-component system, cell cycle sensor histidine kinase and response regulator CckA
LAEELVVLFVGAHDDADALLSMLAVAGITVQLTRVSSWRALTSVSAGWDVVIAGGRRFPAQVDDVRLGYPSTFTTPALVVVPGRPETRNDELGRIDWFEVPEVGRLIPVLRALSRASLAEGRLRQSEHRASLLEQHLRQTGRLHALGQMAAGVAHEFNNVLTVISGYCEQLLPQVHGQDRLERLIHPIQQAGVRGAELSQRLLTFSRQQAPVIGDASLIQAIREATAMLVPLLGETVSLRTYLDKDLPRVRGHQGHLIEIITNLAVNARDAMATGGTVTIESRLATAPVDGGEGMVALVVRDTGSGMDAETLSRACDPFFTTKAQGSGTGLGLSLVRDLVEQCGGTLVIASDLGVGTTVTVTLPGVRREETSLDEIGVPETAAPGGFETVLVVEDDAAVREIVTQFLRGAAYHVLEAKDSEEGLALVKQDPRVIDLLVTDIVLPGASGPELAGHLRLFAPQMRTLFISGYPSDAVGGPKSPVFLAKPFSRAAFLQAVRRALTAPRHRASIDETDSSSRLSDRERTSTQGPIRNGSH